MPPAAWLQDEKQLLDEFISQGEDGMFDFVTAHLEARCFLWMFWEVSQLEVKILSSCAKLLDTWACLEDLRRQETPLTEKNFTLPHIALLVPWRLTFDLAEDIVEWFGERQHLYLSIAIQQLIIRSGNISLHYYLHGELSNLAIAYRTQGERLILEDRLCLDWMKEAMQSEGETIDSETTRAKLHSLIQGGHI